MGKPRTSKNHGKRGRNSTADKVREDVRQCGRWFLRPTKIRQARASKQITCKPPATKDLTKKTPATKDLTKKRKRPSQTVPSIAASEGSCVGENCIPVPAILQQNRGCILEQNRGCILVSSLKDMSSSSRKAFWHEILTMEMLELSSEDED